MSNLMTFHSVKQSRKFAYKITILFSTPLSLTKNNKTIFKELSYKYLYCNVFVSNNTIQ